MQLVYNCDACAIRTGDPYESPITFVYLDEYGVPENPADFEGWEFDPYSLCPDCARRRAARSAW